VRDVLLLLDDAGPGPGAADGEVKDEDDEDDEQGDQGADHGDHAELPLRPLRHLLRAAKREREKTERGGGRFSALVPHAGVVLGGGTGSSKGSDTDAWFTCALMCFAPLSLLIDGLDITALPP